MENKVQIATPNKQLSSIDIKIYMKIISTFKPRTVGIDEFNPLVNTTLSIPCLTLSLLSISLYRVKYLLAKSKILRISSFMLNYAILYYLAVNGKNFYEHIQKFEHSNLNNLS